MQQKSVSDMDVAEDMTPQRPQFYFEVTSIPVSEAPREHREAFVGKVFPLLPRNMDGPEPMSAREVESGRPVDIADAVCVGLRHAVDILRSAGEEADFKSFKQRNP